MTAIRGAVESLRAFGAVFANPSLRRLQLAGIGSTIGTWAYGVGLAVYAYESGGAKTVGLVYFARWTVPRKMRGKLRFCVASTDRAGNKSVASCAALTVK